MEYIKILQSNKQNKSYCLSKILSICVYYDIVFLVQNTTAAYTMLEVGGVEFISQLRPHCDTALHPIIDDILEQLLQLPTTPQESFSSSTTSFEHPETVHINHSDPHSINSAEQFSEHSVSKDPGTLSQNGCPGNDVMSASASTVHTSDVGSYMEISRESFCLRTTSDAEYQGHSSPCSDHSDKSVQVSSWLVDPSIEDCQTGCSLETGSEVLPCGLELPWRLLTENDRGILLATQR